jgi:hypothetical protein
MCDSWWKNLRSLWVGLALGLVCGNASAGLSVTSLGAKVPSILVDNLVGSGISYSNVSYLGSTTSAATFTGGSTIIGFDSGIILSTGIAASVVYSSNSAKMNTNLSLAGDSSLKSMTGQTTYDATVLEFDFVPTEDSIHFEYVFASEEYNVFVGQFNDAFAFFLDGVNVALVPGTSTYVSINNVNNCTNASYYVNNVSETSTACTLSAPVVGRYTSMDGLTTVLSVDQSVVPGTTHHLKLAIADVRDPYYDSNVFLRAGSLLSGNTPTSTPTATQTLTPTQTPTQTLTPTRTPTFTVTLSPTSTQSRTQTETFTTTSTATETATPTTTGTWTLSLTPTETLTSTNTLTPTQTMTPTLTLTSTWTGTWTVTPTVTDTPTVTLSPTVTDTLTITWTPTPTATPLGPLRLWPNPFNPEDAVRGTLKCADMPAGSILTLYTVSGETVVSLTEVGYRVEWNGKTKGGRSVAPGVYYAVVRLGGEVLLKTVLVVSGLP